MDLEVLVANTALINLLNILYLLVYSVMQSSAPLIGNKVGEGNESGVIKIVNAVLLFGVFFSIFIVAVLLIFSKPIFYIYVHDENVLEKMYLIMPIFVLTLVCYIQKDISQAIIIGLGLQNMTMSHNILSYLLIGVPTSLVFTFYYDDIYSGPWIGI